MFVNLPETELEKIRKCSALLGWIGWGLIGLAALDVVSSIGICLAGKVSPEMLLSSFSAMTFKELLPGLLVLLAAQFGRYLFGLDARPRWLLKRGTFILCAAGVAYIYMLYDAISHMPGLFQTSEGQSLFVEGQILEALGWIIMIFVSAVVPNVLFFASKFVIAFVLAYTLRWVLPLIDEARMTA